MRKGIARERMGCLDDGELAVGRTGRHIRGRLEPYPHDAVQSDRINFGQPDRNN